MNRRPAACRRETRSSCGGSSILLKVKIANMLRRVLKLLNGYLRTFKFRRESRLTLGYPRTSITADTKVVSVCSQPPRKDAIFRGRRHSIFVNRFSNLED